MLDLSKLNPGDSNLILHKFMEKNHNKTYAGSNFQSPVPTLTSLRSPHSTHLTPSHLPHHAFLVSLTWFCSIGAYRRKPYLVRMIQDPGHHVIHVYLLGNSAALSYVHFFIFELLSNNEYCRRKNQATVAVKFQLSAFLFCSCFLS